MARDRIELNKEIVPYSYEIPFGDTVYTLEFNYNARCDLFSVNLLLDDELICAGERVVYGHPLFEDSYMVGQYPSVTIVPYDEGGTSSEANYAAVGVTVFLTINDDSAEENEQDVMG